jgi:heptosyltransferase III
MISPTKLLLFHSGALGDLINTLPAISALRRHFPDASITAVGRTDLLALPLAAGLIDEAVSSERPGFHLLFGGGPTRNLPGALVVWLQSFHLCVSWVRAPELARRLDDMGVKTVVQPGPFPPPAGKHAADHMMLALRGLGIDESATAPQLPAPTGGWPGPRFPGIVIHPGSGSPRKNWPADRFSRAASILSERTGLPLAALSGPADGVAFDEVVDRLRAEGKDARPISALTLPELAGLLSSARLLLANDSGVAHLAGAVGVPTVAVFGPSDPEVWGVRQEWAVNVRVSDCRPCFDERRGCGSRECLTGLSAEAVASSAAGLLSRR